MKKKILSILITIFAVCLCMFTFTACGEDEPPHTHVFDKQEINEIFKASDATCEDKGTYYFSCSCGEKGTETFEFDSALGHAYGDWISTGNEQHKKICTKDNAHVLTENCSGGTATCTEKAICNECGTEYGAALEHNYGTPTYTWNDNQCTGTRVCAHDDTHVETVTVTGIYVKDTDATCTTAEKGHYEATFTNSAFTAQATAINSVENGKKLGHSFTNYEYNDDAKCEIDGTETAVCDHNCGESDTKTKAGSSLQHDYAQTQYAWNGNQCIAIRVCNRDNTHIETETATGTYVKDTDVTCTTAEKGHYVATFMNSNFATQSTTPNSVINGEALGHSYASKWEKDAIHHWHKANCEHTSEISEKIEHDFGTDNICDTCEYIRGIAVTGITLNYTSFAVMVGEVKSLIATITPEDATNKNVMWATSNSSVVAVDENGVVTAVGAGNAVVYAVTEDGAKMAQCIVVVIANECEHTTTRTERENEIDSTCKDFGSYEEVVYCSTCNYELSRSQKEIAKKETHTPVTDARVEPTFTETGLTEGSHCSVCGFVIVEQEIIPVKPSKAEISSEKLTINGTTISGKFSYATTEFNFANDISVTNSDTWVLSSDSNGMHTIIKKTATLNEGDNILYIHVENPDKTVTTHTVNIYRNHMYTVSFDTDGGTSVETQYVEEGYLATEPTTTRTGYTFNSWDYDFATPIIANTTITATWSANTNTKYVVKYYLQNLNDSNYALDSTRSYQTVGTTDTTATVTPETIEHFTLNSSKSVLSGNIDGKGNLVLKVYYTRDAYTITTNRNNTKAGTITSGGTYKYDKQITLTATTNDGYTFLGWYNGETKVYSELSYTFNVCETITLTAEWSANTNTKYVVEYYLQNLNDSNYSLDNTRSYQTVGTTDKTATETPETIEHFTLNQDLSVLSGNIDGKGDLVLKVYYTRNVYTITTNRNNTKAGTVTSGGTYKFDKQITVTATTNDGYTFLGWYNGETKVYNELLYTFNVCETITLTAKWSANTDTKYTVIYYLQNIDDDNYTPHETVVLEGETDTMACGETERYAHFTYNASMSLVSGNINGDGSQVLNVYYTRNTYTIAVEGSSYGEVTNTGIYKFGEEVSSTASIKLLGYELVGWYSGDELLSTELSYTFTVNKNVTAKFALRADMSIFNFTSTATTCSITGIKNKSVTRITVPDYVTSISSSAFSGCRNLTEITIPFVGKKAGVTENDTYQYPFGYIFGTSYYSGGRASIQDYYGSSINNATSATYYIPTSLKKVSITGGNILYGAFSGCEDLTSIEIPDSTTSIGDYAFYWCTSLASVIIPDVVMSIGNYAFKDCKSLTDITIPDNVTSIGEGAFYNCDSLTSVVIPDSVTSIGDEAFEDCTSLTSVVIGDSVTSIGFCAFEYCNSLTSVTIGNSVTSIGGDAFYYCSKLVEVYNKSSLNITKGSSNNGYVGYYALAVYTEPYTSKLSTDSNGYIIYTDGNDKILVGYSGVETDLILPDGITAICKYAFYYCSSLTSIVIPDSVTSIGFGAFEYCNSLTSVVIGDSVTSIGSCAFYICTSLTSVVIGDSVTSIGAYAFSDCTSLTSVVIGDSVTSIGVYAFSDCTSLTSVTIGNSVTSIGAYAFYDCDSLTSILIPDSVTSIGYYAFGYCTSLTSVVIGDSVTSIGERAFDGCTSLTSIVIPDSVTSIGNRAFYDCSKLTSIKYRGTSSQWSAISKGDYWNNNTGSYTITYDYTGR